MHDLVEVLEHGISVLKLRGAFQCREDTCGDVFSPGAPFGGLVIQGCFETFVKAFQIVIFRFFPIGQESVLLFDPGGVHGLVKAVGDMEVVQADHSVGEAVFCKVQVGFSHVTAQEADFTALFKCEVIVEVFRELFRGLEGKDVKDFAGPAIGKVGDIFDFRCHGGVGGLVLGIAGSFIKAYNLRQVVGSGRLQELGNSRHIVFRHAVDACDLFFGQFVFQVILNGMEEVPGDAEIGVEPVQMFHESYLAVLTEKPALDEADDGGNTRLGRVLHGTLLAGVIDVAVL